MGRKQRRKRQLNQRRKKHKNRENSPDPVWRPNLRDATRVTRPNQHRTKVPLIPTGPNFKIVPDGYVDAEYCPACGATVNEQTTAALYDAEGNLLEKDFRGVQITFPECGHQFDLADSKREDAGKFYLTDRYICFVGTLPPKSDWLAKFNNDMGCNHE